MIKEKGSFSEKSVPDNTAPIIMYVNGVHTIDGKNYYFDTDGVMCTGWVKVKDEWQYFNSDGSRVDKGIVKGDSVYIIKDGALVTDDKVTVEADESGAISVV